jgi:hypothetical protein
MRIFAVAPPNAAGIGGQASELAGKLRLAGKAPEMATGEGIQAGVGLHFHGAMVNGVHDYCR